MVNEKNEKKMLLVPVGEDPRPIKAKNISSALQCEMFAATFEEVFSDELEIMLFCDDFGKINGSLPNRKIRNSRGELIDIVYGEFVLAAVDRKTGNTVSMPDEAVEAYRLKYKSSNVVLD